MLQSLDTIVPRSRALTKTWGRLRIADQVSGPGKCCLVAHGVMLSMVSTQSAQSPVDTRTVSTSQWGSHWEHHAGQWSSEWHLSVILLFTGGELHTRLVDLIYLDSYTPSACVMASRVLAVLSLPLTVSILSSQNLSDLWPHPASCPPQPPHKRPPRTSISSCKMMNSKISTANELNEHLFVDQWETTLFQ